MGMPFGKAALNAAAIIVFRTLLSCWPSSCSIGLKSQPIQLGMSQSNEKEKVGMLARKLPRIVADFPVEGHNWFISAHIMVL